MSAESIAFVVVVVLVLSNFSTFRQFYHVVAIPQISLDMLVTLFDYFAVLLVVSFGCWHFY